MVRERFSRRAFLKSAVATGAAATLTSQAPACAGAPESDPLESILFRKLGAPKREGMLDVSDNHRIHWEEYGNLNGEPIMYIHGGPGSGISRTHLRMMDPVHYHIIAFDQRGCGKSTFGEKHITGEQLAEARLRDENVDDLVKAMLKGNTTADLINDIDALCKRVGIPDGRKMHLFGGSWGSTLALAYAIAHPDKVKSLTLRGIYLGRQTDNDWSYQGNATNLDDNTKAGAYQFYPEEWKRFVEFIPPERPSRK